MTRKSRKHLHVTSRTTGQLFQPYIKVNVQFIYLVSNISFTKTDNTHIGQAWSPFIRLLTI